MCPGSDVSGAVATVPRNAYENVLSAAGPRDMTSSLTSRSQTAATASSANYVNV